MPAADLVEDALKTAAAIAAMPPMAAMMNKELVNLVFETNLCQSVSREHSLFQILTTIEDTTESIKAFIKRSAGNWKGH